MKLLYILTLACISCNTHLPNIETPQTEIHDNTQPAITYQASLKKLDSIKKQAIHKNVTEQGKLFSQYMYQSIFPYWYGTPWDFNGITELPGKGYIACGYFVTTTLRDAGVKLNRVKMAQCASEEMITSLTTFKENYSSLDFKSFIQQVKSKGEGISVIGLDNHTGFLYYDGSELYFIHSTYLGTKNVQKDIAEKNIILQTSKYKVVGYISKDPQFLKKWVKP